jgi:hypothetical protein
MPKFYILSFFDSALEKHIAFADGCADHPS